MDKFIAKVQAKHKAVKFWIQDNPNWTMGALVASFVAGAVIF